MGRVDAKNSIAILCKHECSEDFSELCVESVDEVYV